MHDDHDHAPEPIPGLPTELPEGEEILWQGSPDVRSFLLRVVHLRKVVIYFGIILLATLVADLAAGVAPGVVAGNAISLALVALLPLGMLWFVGRRMAHTAIYTITNRRVVMRFGVALPISVNLPFGQIASADLRLFPDGTGDVPLTLVDPRRTNYAVMWPHARPWHPLQVQPAFRCIPDPESVSRMLAEAWSAATGEPARPQREATGTAPGGLEPLHH